MAAKPTPETRPMPNSTLAVYTSRRPIYVRGVPKATQKSAFSSAVKPPQCFKIVDLKLHSSYAQKKM
ncbi:hypothetical protein N7510_000025 [Penicillium lagena]|uniref:uncharacterized protein n=1 Tax=Penicillium lagena TaxID=94218 RepID=UPI002541D457|nr:uncharacterized protein N7510_000025 [Penicillium lagena]KAJ5623716.1 hypothetical protein N7510_000025 [Penicillium lagena]